MQKVRQSSILFTLNAISSPTNLGDVLEIFQTAPLFIMLNDTQPNAADSKHCHSSCFKVLQLQMTFSHFIVFSWLESENVLSNHLVFLFSPFSFCIFLFPPLLPHFMAGNVRVVGQIVGGCILWRLSGTTDADAPIKHDCHDCHDCHDDNTSHPPGPREQCRRTRSWTLRASLPSFYSLWHPICSGNGGESPLVMLVIMMMTTSLSWKVSNFYLLRPYHSLL